MVAGGLFGKKSVLNIKDNNNYYLINISGDNKVTGLTPNSITCSRLFQVEGYSDGYNLMPNEKGRRHAARNSDDGWNDRMAERKDGSPRDRHGA